MNSDKAGTETIIAMRDSYVDVLIDPGTHASGTVLFKLNTFDIDREQFKFAQDTLLAQLASARVDEDYVEQLVRAPLAAGIRVAEADLEHGTRLLEQAEKRFEVGLIALTDVYDARFDLTTRQAALLTAKVEKDQRELEVAGQRRKLNAELENLKVRAQLNAQIKLLNQYVLTESADVEVHTFAGAFVEEGDSICTITWREALARKQLR